MSNYWGPQRPLRPVRSLELDYAGSGSQVSTTFLSETFQVRASSDVRGYLYFGLTAPTTTSRDTATIELYANTGPEFVSARRAEKHCRERRAT
jgi:hypothetical protein